MDLLRSLAGFRLVKINLSPFVRSIPVRRIAFKRPKLNLSSILLPSIYKETPLFIVSQKRATRQENTAYVVTFIIHANHSIVKFAVQQIKCYLLRNGDGNHSFATISVSTCIR